MIDHLEIQLEEDIRLAMTLIEQSFESLNVHIVTPDHPYEGDHYGELYTFVGIAPIHETTLIGIVFTSKSGEGQLDSTLEHRLMSELVLVLGPVAEKYKDSMIITINILKCDKCTLKENNDGPLRVATD